MPGAVVFSAWVALVVSFARAESGHLWTHRAPEWSQGVKAHSSESSDSGYSKEAKLGRVLPEVLEKTRSSEIDEHLQKGQEVITVVHNATAMLEAVMRGSPHIELQHHIDVRGLFMPSSHGHIFGRFLPPGIQSIRGNCSEQPPKAMVDALSPSSVPLRQLQPGQCLILTDAPLFVLGQESLWLHAVYVRRSCHLAREPFEPLIQVYPSAVDADVMVPPRLWMTDVTLQGDGGEDSNCDICALRVPEGYVYAEGCTFADFNGNQVLSVGDGDSSVALVNSTLADNRVWPDTWYDEGHALISAMSSEYRDDYAPWIILKTTVLVLLRGCTFEGNAAAHKLLATGGDEGYEPKFFSDSSMKVYLLNYEEFVHTEDPREAPKGALLTGSDEWIVNLREKLKALPRQEFVPSLGPPAADISKALMILCMVGLLLCTFGTYIWHQFLWADDTSDRTSDDMPTQNSTGNYRRHVSPLPLPSGASPHRPARAPEIAEHDSGTESPTSDTPLLSPSSEAALE